MNFAGYAARLNERSKDRQGKVFVPRIRGVVEHQRQLRLSRKRAEPLAIFIENAPQLPFGKFNFDQSKRGITPRTGCDQLFDPARVASIVENGKARARVRGNIGDEIGCERGRKPKPISQTPEMISMLRIEKHDTIPPAKTVSIDRGCRMGLKAVGKRERPACDLIWMA